MPERPSVSVGILGAGPGGLSLARFLTERGFRNVTVLERSERVGGKSLTFQHEGLGHDVGTCYHTYGYTYVRRWMREYGIGAHRLPRHIIHLAEGGTTDFKSFVRGASASRLCAELGRYATEWTRFFAMQELGHARSVFDAEVSVPFSRWLRDRRLDAVERFALRSMTAMGYGHLDDVPALYGLRWNTPSLLLSAAALRVEEPVPGWAWLWQAMAATMDVRLGWDTERVVRMPGGIGVHAKDGRSLRFDHFVVSTPLDEAGSFLPLSEEERSVFSQVRWSEYVTTLVEADGWFTDADTHSFEASLRGANGSARGEILVARRTGDKTPVAAARRRSRPNVYVVYQYGSPQLGDGALGALLERGLQARSGRVRRVLGRWRWKYAPTLTPDAIASGAVWRMEALQGRQNTWYTGASLSHEAVDTIVDYNVKLADRMEQRIRRLDEQRTRGWWWPERRAAHRLLTHHNK